MKADNAHTAMLIADPVTRDIVRTCIWLATFLGETHPRLASRYARAAEVFDEISKQLTKKEQTCL